MDLASMAMLDRDFGYPSHISPLRMGLHGVKSNNPELPLIAPQYIDLSILFSSVYALA